MWRAYKAHFEAAHFYCYFALCSSGAVWIDYSDQNTSGVEEFVRVFCASPYDIFVFISQTRRENWPDPDVLKVSTNYFEEPVTIGEHDKKKFAEMKDKYTLVNTIDFSKTCTIFVWRKKNDRAGQR